MTISSLQECQSNTVRFHSVRTAVARCGLQHSCTLRLPRVLPSLSFIYFSKAAACIF